MVKVKASGKIINEGIIGAGVCFIIALICAIIAITAYRTDPALTTATTIIAIIAILAMIMLLVFLLVGDYHCYYCKRKVLYPQEKIEVSWSEPAKYSDDEIVNITKVFHARCHQAAKEKGIAFKIPDPRFSQIPI